MKRVFLMLVTAMLVLNCSMNVCAEEGVTDEIVEENKELETKVVATDIKTIRLEQIGQPTIPGTPFNGSLVQDAEVIYRIRYKVTAKTINNQIVTNRAINNIVYTGPVKGSKFTNIDSRGIGYIDIDVRGAHNITIYCRLKSSSVKSNTISSNLATQAKYEKTFYCTGYNTAVEEDWTGAKISIASLGNDTYRSDFLDNVKLNGSGKAENGKYIHYDSKTNTYSYTSPVTASGTTPTVGRTIAVDPSYIPRYPVNGVWKRATVSIANVGTRTAEDGGAAINGYHIDVYMGLGKKAMQGWSSQNRVVTLLSIK